MEEDDFNVEVSSDTLKQISDLARRQLRLEAELEQMEVQVKLKQEELRYVSENLLPNAMLEAGGMSMFALDSGEQIKIKKDLYCSVPKEGFPAVEEWLRARGFEGIIKHQIMMQFGKGEDDAAIRAAEILIEAGYSPTDSKTIHPQTLKAFIKEQLGQGVDIPLKTFGAHEVTKTQIILPKR